MLKNRQKMAIFVGTLPGNHRFWNLQKSKKKQRAAPQFGQNWTSLWGPGRFFDATKMTKIPEPCTQMQKNREYKNFAILQNRKNFDKLAHFLGQKSPNQY